MQIRKKTIVCMLLFILFVGNAVAQNLITNVYGRYPFFKRQMECYH